MCIDYIKDLLESIAYLVTCLFVVLSVSIESQEPCKCSKPNYFYHTLSKSASHRHKWLPIIIHTMQCSKVHGYSKQTLPLATVKIKPLFMYLCLYAHCKCEQDRKTVAVRWSLFPRQQQAPYHPHKLDSDPRTGFPLTHCLCRARADPACDSSRLCVTASVLLAFHNAHSSLNSFPPLLIARLWKRDFSTP